ncbi:MAG: hypothetical protein ACI9WU_005501, partial [Myxococcota bacterium]
RVELSCEGKLHFGSADEAGYQCPVDWWLTPGTHTVTVTADAQIYSKELTVPGESTDTLWVHAVAPLPTKAVPAPVVAEPAHVPVPEVIAPPPVVHRDTGISPAWGWATASAGVLLVAGAATLHGLASSDNEDLHDRFGSSANVPAGTSAQAAYDRAYDADVAPRATAAWILYGVGAAVLTTGIVLLVTGQDTAEPAAITLTPMGLPDGGGMRLDMAW